MHSEFYSVVAALPTKEARRIVDKLKTNQKLGVLVGPDDVTLTEFKVTTKVDKSKLAAAFQGKIPRAGMVEGASVDVDQETLDELAENAAAYEVVESDTMSVLSALDRVLALPHGISILDGKAVRRLSPDEQELLEEEWGHLLDRLGGAEYAAELVAPHVGGEGEADALEMITVLDDVIKTARKKKLDVLLLCCPAPPPAA